MDEKLHLLRRDKHFIDDAVELLKDTEPYYKLAPVYKIRTDHLHYCTFLEFLVEELEDLPFNDEVGRTILMRPDAQEVVANLSSNLRSQLTRLKQGLIWDNDISSLESYFYRSLEVFKSEIYPEMNIHGIGYNLDLGNLYTLKVPQKLILERYHVDARSEFNIQTNGSITTYFLNGSMEIDLTKDHPGGVHVR